MSSSEKKDQFNRLFGQKHGMRLNVESDEFMSKIRSECQRTISLYSNEDIYFDIIDNNGVNAVAGKLDGAYYIGIYRGAIRVFDYLARKIASHPELLVEFGDPLKENNSDKVFNAIIKYDYAIDEDSPVNPATKQRQVLSLFIFEQALQNILFHELAHVLNGHIDLFESLGLGYFEEKHVEQLASLLSLDRQILELDADDYSGEVMMKELLRRYDTNYLECRSILTDTRLIYKLWSFVRFICWRLLENSYTGKNLLSITHPPTGIRHEFSRISCINLVQTRGESEKAALQECYVLGASAADEAFRLLSERDSVSPPLDKSNSTLQYTHAGLLFCHWDTVRGKLMKFCKIPLRDVNNYDNVPNEIKRGYDQLIKQLKANE